MHKAIYSIIIEGKLNLFVSIRWAYCIQGCLKGDLLIGLERIRDKFKSFKVNNFNNLYRVVIMGYD